MYSMPGKIAFVKKATIDVFPKSVEVSMNQVVISTDGHGEFIDETDNITHTLTFNGTVDELYIENLSVGHLLENNTLTFTTPIYRWLLANIDTK